MDALPDMSNYYSALHTTMSREQVAVLYRGLGWQVRKCSWTDYEVFGPWCELVIEAESPILMHGAVADLLVHAEELVAPFASGGCILYGRVLWSRPRSRVAAGVTVRRLRLC
jgi:hypothetical protein